MPNPLTLHSRCGIGYYFLTPLLFILGINFSSAQNAIVTENLNAGVPASQWDIPLNSNGTFGDKTIQGFGTDISVNVGGTINFKITVTSGTNKTFGIKIYRIGYYQGNGARQIADLGTAFAGITQNACSFDNVTGLTDCGNWTTSASWTVPSTAVSGLYIAKLTRSAAGGGGSSHIAFIVRNDASTSPLLFKTSDATWQAYNPYGGYSLYVGAGMPFNHGNKVSYNRPYLTRDGGGGGGASEDFFMNAEYPMIRFLERNGFDISYTTDVDMARSTSNPVTNHKVFLSTGHDEYWSKEERNTVEAARAAGKSLAFFSGNEVYWKTRWENSVDGTNTPFRTMVCYKEGTLPTPGENACGGKCDPTTEWTGLWRDGCSFPSGNACKPENALTGEISWDGTTGTIKVPDTYKNLRFWRNTSVATLAAGQTATMTPGTLGYEWDWEQYQSSYPPGRITMSNTSFDGHVHKLSFYKSSAGGLVFGAGSVQWSWGLDANHDSNEQGGGGAATVAMQQATINLFADMGVQPGSIQTGLTAATASTDVTPPVTKFTSPANGATFTSLSPITFSGTATDDKVVAGVEISFDGGVTWAAATGTTSWTYSWTPLGNGSFTVIVRGIDDSGNYTATASSPSITITVNATAQNCPCNIFGTAAPTVTVENDNSGGIVVGTKFRSALNGTVTGIRFYKASGNSGTHQGLLYNNTGTLLAQATFTGETATGWQQVSFSTPVTIVAGQTYIAAYFSSSGNYSSTNAYFTQAKINSPLTGLADGTDGTNGVYIYASAPAFPINSYQQGNYWVDPVFTNTTTVTANAGTNQTVTLPLSTVTLNGSASTGAITSYAWSVVSGPNTPTITTPSTVSTTVTGLIQGTYVFKLSVNGGVSTAQVTILVNPIPPPMANAGPKQTITLPTSTVTLDGSGSTGTISSYAWSLISGPNTPAITTPATAKTTVTGLIQGTYIFQLALNGTASIAKDTVIVNPAAPPVANAGSNQTITLPVSTVTLNGNNSTGTITSYAWTRISGPNTPVITAPTAVSTTVTGLIQGTYVFQLSLNGGASTSQTTVNVVAAPTSVPIFTTQTPAGATQTDGLALEMGVKFRTTTAGSITGIRFYKTSGNTGTHTGELYSSTGTRLAQAVFTNETATGWQQVLFSSPVTITAGTTYVAAYFSSSGKYTSTTNYFTTSVVNGPITALADGTDGSNGVYKYSTTPAFPNSTYQKSNYWVDALFSSAPVAPVANAGVNQTIALPVSTVTLNGSGSTGTISSYAWTLVSGPNVPVITTPAAVSTTVTGLIQGTYIFKLSLNGAVSTSQVTVTVNAAQTVVANAGSNQTIMLPASSVTLNGSGSTGSISSYAWTRISGPGTPIITTPSGVTTSVTGLIQGTYVFQLSLNGGVSVSQVTVNVVPASVSTTIFTTQTPSVTTSNDGIGIETGVKFRSSVGGMITGIRFYKTSGNTGTHTGELYSSIGTRLAQAVFTNETATGWQNVIFSTPVPITAGVTYIAACYSSSGNYISTNNYFATALVNAPLTALADGTDGPNGVFVYGNFAAFPVNSSSKTNYWVDAIFNGSVNTVDITAPGILVTSPASASTNISANSSINVFFNEQLNPSTVSGNTVFLKSGTTTIPSSVINNTEGGVTLTPSSPLNPNTVYSMTVKGGTGTNKITDVAGNALAKDTVWNFTTAPSLTTAIPANGPGGPILLISSGSNAFSRYPVEILRAEGWNAFNALDISAVTTTEINKYDVVIVGDITLTAAQVTLLTNWVTAGGTLVALHPDSKLSALLGITSAGGTMADKYLLVNTASAPGLGIVNQTIQYHGTANLYNVNAGTNIVATLYSDATTATIYPAVTSRNVGTLGGQAIAFTYDLAKSVVYTRQGNPAWAGENRDGQDAVIRSDNLFFGNASFDPQPDWVNLNKVAIPQADEQQRLLTNIIMAGNFDRKPLPRFWFLPKGKKAAVVMTGDDHANGGTMGRFNKYLAMSSSNTPDAVANWNAIRSTSYMYPFSPITNAQIAMYQNQGFDLAFHLNPNCSVWTPASLQNYFDSQLSDFKDEFYAINPLVSHRIHCLSWSDWSTLPKTEIQLGIRLNVSYYYWPGSWINNRPGMFTGSGMPMRFADTDGSLIDSYQVPSQMTDESGQAYPMTIDSLLIRATGPRGYYGVFCANMHTDDSVSSGSDAIIASAQALQIPVVSSRQMLDWLDARNNSTFSNYTWLNGTLGFTVAQDPRALNLKGMLPQTISAGSFISLTQNGLAANTTIETIKGISYVFFDASNGNYVATYAVTAPGAGNNAALAQITSAADSVSSIFPNYLGQNYPNPFSLNTRINYSIAASNVVELILYDMQGRPVKTLVNEVKQAGNYIYDLNTGNLAKGVYFYRIRSGSFVDVRKLIIE
ncbi:MAG TPA: DUF4082 domain-containing protein [Puia sp.]|nr:DUF4082 domain-containing protein [Puia sp.]